MINKLISIKLKRNGNESRNAIQAELAIDAYEAYVQQPDASSCLVLQLYKGIQEGRPDEGCGQFRLRW